VLAHDDGPVLAGMVVKVPRGCQARAHSARMRKKHRYWWKTLYGTRKESSHTDSKRLETKKKKINEHTFS
jgi:hypothetical protein